MVKSCVLRGKHIKPIPAFANSIKRVLGIAPRPTWTREYLQRERTP